MTSSPSQSLPLSPQPPRQSEPQPRGQGSPASAAITEDQLAELLAAFNSVTEKLASTQRQLQAEIASLRAQLTESQAQAERARHLALLGEMAAGIAHEIRNPLGSIRLYAKMLQDDLAALPGPLGIAEKIDRSVRRLEHVVGDVLTFSRQLSVRAVSFDAADLLSAAAEASGSEAAWWQAVTVELKPTAANLPAVHGDPDLLRQALVNLIRNAAEAMADAKSPRRIIKLSVERTKVRDEQAVAKQMLAISVTDSGPGIPEDVLPRLFEPFFTTRSDGTGLGLAIVHRIADAHGGRVVARNVKPGAPGTTGAIFELLLPVATSA